MKLKFKNQKFQTDAAKAVTDVFKQQRKSDMQEYLLDTGYGEAGTLSVMDVMGFRNHPLAVSPDQLLENIRAIQMDAQLKPSVSVNTRDLRLTIEMATGTGKT